MGQVPAATRTLRVLRFLASQPAPVPLERIAAAVGLPRSTAYHLLAAMVAEGFVVHLTDDHRYGLGVAAFEVGSGYARQARARTWPCCTGGTSCTSWRSARRAGRRW
jgi:DNA-binding IclR family transcriptional regulator